MGRGSGLFWRTSPHHAPHLFDLAEAARSQAYCDDVAGMLAGHGVQITELSTHLQGQLVAVHPAYDSLFDGFAPPDKRGNPAARQAWAVEQLLAAKASQRLGLTAHATFSGALAWPYLSLAAAPARTGGRSLRRTRPPLAPGS
jgi:sugar phosphate isomerase/epimerase